MTTARYRCLKCLRRTEFHARAIRRQAQGDVAGNRQRARAGFCRIGMAGGRDLHRRRRWQVRWRGIYADRSDRSERRAPAWHAADAPTNGDVSCVRYCRRESRLAAEHD